MRLTCTFLSEQEKQRIHADSLAILSNVGVKFLSARAFELGRQGRQLFHVAAAVTPWSPAGSTPLRARLHGLKFLNIELSGKRPS